MIVMKSATAKKCYAYNMENKEATSDEIKAVVLQVGKIGVSRHRVPVIQSQYNHSIMVPYAPFFNS